jgi:2-amino-4-hydroxy-6-hydroxymethyldihydropteridine diphosphokinase
MNEAYLLTGGNMGKREYNLAAAREWIEKKCGPVLKASGLYETAAWGKTDQPSFLNQALCLRTSLSPHELLQELLTVEKKLGRIREEKYGPRTIDIDILLFGHEIIDEPRLSLPHPELQNRRFALVPLAEIAREFVHPVFQQTIGELLDLCDDPLEVTKLDV